MVQIVLKYGLIKFDKENICENHAPARLLLASTSCYYMLGVSVQNQNKAGQFGKYVLNAVK